MAALGSNRSIDGGLNGGPQRAQCGIVDHFLARGEHELQRWGVDDINPGGPRIRSIDFFDRRQSTGDLDAVKIDAWFSRKIITPAKDANPAAVPVLDPMGSLEGILARQRFAVKMDRQREMRSEEHTSELQSLMRISYAVLV